MRKVVAAIALTFMVGSAGEHSARAQELLAMTDGAARGTGAVHEVQMVLNDAGEYRYVPDELTIKVGDTVRWINASGGPHNVAFRVDGIPEGAADVARRMPAHATRAPAPTGAVPRLRAEGRRRSRGARRPEAYLRSRAG